MFVAGIDAHATYSVIAIVSNTGELVHKPVRIKNNEADRLDELLAQFRPLEVVVETSPAWPWLFDRGSVYIATNSANEPHQPREAAPHRRLHQRAPETGFDNAYMRTYWTSSSSSQIPST